jgi:L-fuculose-phosphate aldolase
VRPFAHDHNTILLSNHGIVCWADTVSHAEWLVETFETYCKTFLIARQIGRPLKFLPPEKIGELLEIKRRQGLPDSRLTGFENSRR